MITHANGVEDPVLRVLERLEGVQGGDGQWTARCPAHEDNQNSLSIARGDDGKALLHCHAGCSMLDVVIAARLEMKDLFTDRSRRRTKQAKREVAATYDYTDEQGELLYQAVRYRPKGFAQRKPDGRGDWIWKLGSDQRRVPYRLPAILAEPDRLLLIVEGEKDAATAGSLGFLTTTNAGGSGNWTPLLSETVFGRPSIVIIADNDLAGRKREEKIARSLHGRVGSLKIVRLFDDPPAKKDGKDITDWRDAGGTAEQLQSLIDAAPEWEPSQAEAESSRKDDNRVPIEVSCREDQVVADVVLALAQDQDVFVQDSRLVYVAEHGDAKSAVAHRATDAVIRPLEKDYLRTRISAQVRFYQETEDGEIEKRPPVWAVNAVHACGSWRNRPIRGVTVCPFLTPEGEVVTEPGYNTETAIYLRRATSVEIPEQCSLEDAKAAAAKLVDLFCDFPFEADHNYAAAIAAVLTEPAKYLFSGPVPAFPIDANVRGSGKTLLATVIYAVQTGDQLAIQTEIDTSEEWHKTITTLAIEGATTICIDNADRSIGSKHLDAALTSTRWKSRILGSSKSIDVPFRPTWFLTGNNLAYSGDLMRRVVPIRLISDQENPEQRTGFKHPEIARYAREHHAELIGAALTILRAFQQAGSPQADLTAFGSFEGWSSVVRQAVVWIGLPDPCAGARQAAQQADPIRDALQAILDSWLTIDPGESGVTAAQVFRAIERDDELRSDFAALCRCPIDRVDGNKIGQAFRHSKGRIVSGYTLEDAGKLRGRTVWQRSKK